MPEPQICILEVSVGAKDSHDGTYAAVLQVVAA